MPDAGGRIPPVAIPRVPWCLRCKLVDCVCPPVDAVATERIDVPPVDRRRVHRFATPVVTERRSARLLS